MINISSISFKNFLSVGNVPSTIVFDAHKKTILTASNGQGKSILCCALVYGLFGKPFRDIKKPQLINNINKKGLEVTVHFSIKDSSYKIIRGMAPNIFEIYVGDSLIPQDSKTKDYQKYLEEEILNMNLKTFTQIVILGSSNYIPFMRMSAQSKREIIEDILNISIFSRMNELLKLKLKDQEVSIQLAEKEKEFNKKQYTFLFEKYSQNKLSVSERMKTKQEYLDKLKLDLFNTKGVVEHLESTMLPIPHNAPELKSQKKKLETFKTKIEGNLQRAVKELQFYADNTKCSKCNTELTEEHKKKHTVIIEESKQKFIQALSELDVRIGAIVKKLEEVSSAEHHNTKVTSAIASHKKDIESLQSTIRYVEKEMKELTTSVTEVIKEEELEELKSTIHANEASIQKKYKEYDVFKKGLHILKDTGAKTKIINFYLPLINNTVNSYLEKFNFNVLFSFNENFEESFKARNYDSYSYGNFSEGEKLRLDLSILFAFREITKRKNSANVNLLFFDEVLDSSMDAIGIEHFFSVMDDIGVSGENVNFFVISHREGVESFFDRQIVAKKVNGFTSYKELLS